MTTCSRSAPSATATTRPTTCPTPSCAWTTSAGIPQGWVEGLTVAAVACLIYAIVVLIRILCGKYDEVKLPDITFELVDMTPETPAEPEAEPEEAPEAPAEPETPEAPAEPENSDETEDTPDA